jgi:hypothetical protein
MSYDDKMKLKNEFLKVRDHQGYSSHMGNPGL